MKKLLLFITTLSILASLFIAKAKAQSDVITQNPVTIIGDSLSVGATPYYKTFLSNITPPVDAKESQPWSWGINELRTISQNGQLAPILVFEFGTNNSALKTSDLQDVFSLAKDSKVIFVNIYDSADPTRVNNVNPVLQSAQSFGATVVDWNGLASQHPEWFGADGVHPNATPEGYKEYARLIAQAVAGTFSPPPTTAVNAPSDTSGSTSYQTLSNLVTTRVGDPPLGTDCPIPNGVVTCGSKFTPISGCGHCGVGYPPAALQAFCNYPEIDYAMDIGGSDFQDIILPKVNNHVIKWSFQKETKGATEQIQYYTGVDQENDDKYIISFHHTAIGSGAIGDHLSGEVGAKICGNGCNERHVHVELTQTTPTGPKYLDAPLYFCNANSGVAAVNPVTTTTGADSLKKRVQTEFGIIMNGFDQKHLQWAYDKLKDVSGTKFLTLIHGTAPDVPVVIGGRSYDKADPYSQQEGCTTKNPDLAVATNSTENIKLAYNFPGDSNGEIFKITLMHELGHMIQLCPTFADSHYLEHERIRQDEKEVTYYAHNAGVTSSGCPTSNVSMRNEDYAEMVAYYLNPASSTKDVCGNGRQANPYWEDGHPQHKALVNQILGDYP